MIFHLWFTPNGPQHPRLCRRLKPGSQNSIHESHKFLSHHLLPPRVCTLKWIKGSIVNTRNRRSDMGCRCAKQQLNHSTKHHPLITHFILMGKLCSESYKSLYNMCVFVCAQVCVHIIDRVVGDVTLSGRSLLLHTLEPILFCYCQDFTPPVVLFISSCPLGLFFSTCICVLSSTF